MEKKEKNITLVASESNDKGWFNVYIDFSGHKEYLMPHRNNTRIYKMLCSGISIEALQRVAKKEAADMTISQYRYVGEKGKLKLKRIKNRSRKLENSIDHLLLVAKEYLEERKSEDRIEEAKLLIPHLMRAG